MRSIHVLILLVPLVAAGAEPTAQPRRGPFTQPPRSVRSRDVDQRHIRLDLRFDVEKQEMQGRAALTLTPFKPTSKLALDAAEMQIKRVAVELAAPQSGPRDLKYQTQGQAVEVELDREYRVGDVLVVAIDYVVTRPQHGVHFVVPDESEPNQPRMLWTQSEPEFAHYWFPCLDSPTDRVTSEILATVPQAYLTLSNGELKSKTTNADGSQTWHWEQKQSHVPYLLSLVAGDFEELKQDWNGVPVLSYVPRGRLAEAPRSFGQTPEMMSYFSRQIGVKYPWPKYAQICVDEYMWGGDGAYFRDDADRSNFARRAGRFGRFQRGARLPRTRPPVVWRLADLQGLERVMVEREFCYVLCDLVAGTRRRLG